MKRLGLIGGTSWHSTIEYYRAINELVNEHFGDNTNPPLVLCNLNQAEVHQYQSQGQWDKIAQIFIEASQRLVAAGVDGILFCANTPHRVYPDVDSVVSVPIIHIADATANAIKLQNIESVAFIGTRYSMEQEFVTGRIRDHGIRVFVPETDEELQELHRTIHEELSFGRIEAISKQYVLNSLAAMVDQGAQGVVLGCTEFPLMFPDRVLDLPTFNTTSIHAEAAVRFILDDH
ncbi:MAG: amino acid racemase [Planctomycetota bacterium]